MRRFNSIVRATALEILSEPLSLLVMLAALALAVLAPGFHYHQFGEATRMARDAGLSALFTGGSVIAVFGTVRSFRREIESGTMSMALAHSVSRGRFFLAKAAGAFVAYCVFAIVLIGTTMVIFEGAEIGGIIARRTGDIARIFGPCMAAGVSIMLLPMLLAAALNRFARFRFVLSSHIIALVITALAIATIVFLSRGYVLRLLPASLLLIAPAAVLLTASAAFAVRLKANAAVAASGAVFAVMLPAIGNYYLSDALSNGGSVPWTYVGMALMAAAPAVILFLMLGIHFITGRDIQ